MTTANDITFEDLPQPDELKLTVFLTSLIPECFNFLFITLTQVAETKEPSVQDIVDVCQRIIRNNDIVSDSKRVGVAAFVLAGIACACGQKQGGK